MFDEDDPDAEAPEGLTEEPEPESDEDFDTLMKRIDEEERDSACADASGEYLTEFLGGAMGAKKKKKED